jgi:hypothetical protein
MTTTREKIAGQAKIGPVKFWATRAAQQPTPRRIVQYSGIGVDGATTEDLGEDAHVEILNATVDETVYMSLLIIKQAADVVTCAHPLFGVFQGRLVDVTYDAGPDPMVDIVCTIIEHGEPADIFPLLATSTAAKKQSADSVFDDISGDLDDLDDMPSDSGLPAAAQGMSNGYANFTAMTSAVSQGNALWTDAAAAYTELSQAANVLVEAIETTADATQAMVDIVDSTYELLNEAWDFVEVMKNETAQVWQDFQVVHPLSLAEIALDIMGDASEETLDILLNNNPTLVDICAIPVGTALTIPVTL